MVSTLGTEFPRRARRNSISPRGLALVFALLAAVSMTIAVTFAVLGAWLILPFAGLEVLCLGAAFLHVARRADG